MHEWRNIRLARKKRCPDIIKPCIHASFALDNRIIGQTCVYNSRVLSSSESL
jgi:hypothetical protein